MVVLVRALVMWPMGRERGLRIASRSRSRSSRGEEGVKTSGEVGSREEDMRCSAETAGFVTSVKTTITFFISYNVQGDRERVQYVQCIC